MALGLAVWTGHGEARSSIETTVGAPPQEVPTGALDAYVRGLAHLNEPSSDSTALAIEALREATDLAPTFGKAWAGLAQAYAQDFDMGPEHSPKVLERARAAARHAVTLEPEHVGALCSMGFVELLSYRDWSSAGQWFEKAVALDPTSVRGWQGTTWMRLAEGRVEEAHTAARRSYLLAPDNADVVNTIAMTLFVLDRPEEALAVLRSARERGVEFEVGPLTLQSSIEAHLGQWEAAKATYLEMLTVLNRPGSESIQLEAIFNEQGFDAMSRHVVELLPELSHLTRAVRLVHLQDIEGALDILEEGARIEGWDMFLVGIHPGFRPLDGNPRYESIVADLQLGRPQRDSGKE